MLKLYGYYRSSAAYRVRIALNLKQLEYDSIPVHLVKDGGEQHTSSFRELNPQGLVPVLQEGDLTISQSMAIIEYLEEAYPDTQKLLPEDIEGRARVRSLSQLIACEIHPLNNLRVLKYLQQNLGLSEEAKTSWYQHWVDAGFQALEARLSCEPSTGKFCHGDTPTMADVCLIPQIYNARRFACDMDQYPTLVKIEQTCHQLNAFLQATPERQQDACSL